MAGDSHTGFDSGAFSAGAIGGAMTIAGAMVAGIQNARRQNWERFNRSALIVSLEYSDEQRAYLYKNLQIANRKIGDLQTEVISLRAEIKAERARQLLVSKR